MLHISDLLSRGRQRQPDFGQCLLGRWLAPTAAFLLPLVTYWATMARGLVWGDGIELATVSATLGIAHPTGYPLFTMVGHLFTQLPFGTVVARVTFFCALSVAGSTCLLYGLLLRWIRLRRPAASGLSPRSLALAGALTFAWSTGPWSHATVTEVYAFQGLIQWAALFLASRALRDGSRRALGLLALTLGLGMAHHLLTLVLFPFLIVSVLVVARRQRLRTLSSKLGLLTGVGGLFLVGLLPLLYLPLRASQAPSLSWGDPSNVERWLWSVSGGRYLGERFLTGQPGTPLDAASLGPHLAARFVELGTYLAGQILTPRGLPSGLWVVFCGVGAALLGLGSLWIFRRQRAFALAWAAALGLYLLVLLTYNIRDIADYQLGFFGLLWPVLWIGLLQTAGCRPLGSGSHQGAPRQGISWVVLVLPFTLLLANYRALDRSRGDLADVYASRLLASLPRDAILLTDGDYSTASAWYQQEVEGQRRDVLVYCLNFLDQPWYLTYFERRELKGRRVGVAGWRLRSAEEFQAQLARLVIHPNIEKFPVFMAPSPALLRSMKKRYSVEYAGHLMSDEEYGEALEGDVYPPPPLLFRLRSLQERPET